MQPDKQESLLRTGSLTPSQLFTTLSANMSDDSVPVYLPAHLEASLSGSKKLTPQWRRSKNGRLKRLPVVHFDDVAYKAPEQILAEYPDGYFLTQ